MRHLDDEAKGALTIMSFLVLGVVAFLLGQNVAQTEVSFTHPVADQQTQTMLFIHDNFGRHMLPAASVYVFRSF